MSFSGRPSKALEDDVWDKGVGAVPTTLQAEIMPSGKNRVLSLSKKSLVFWSSAARGQNVASDKSGGVTVACKT